MAKRNLLFIFLIGIIVFSTAGLLLPVPGYMDAEYYYSGGVQLFQGKGFQEPYLWNYLDNPQGIPHPSHTYWMPVPSVLAAAGMLLFNSRSFLAAKIFFILLAACIPVLTAIISYSIGNNRRNAWISSLLAIFPGFYLIYYANTETFTPYMILGSLFLLVASSKPLTQEIKVLPWIGIGLGLGILAGLMHLTRADGLLWLVGGACLFFYQGLLPTHGAIPTRIRLRNGSAALAMLLVGYLLVMFPWFFRNYQLYGTPLSPGGGQTLWLTNYDETFIYPASDLNISSWVASGFRLQANARMSALGINLKNMLAVQGEVFLLPFILVGLWKFRKNRLVILGLVIWFVTLGVMTLVFPFSGSRGGFIHSGAALQPIFWAVVPCGLERVLQIGVRWRKWNYTSASIFFSSGIILLSMILTGYFFVQVVLGKDLSGSPWKASTEQYQTIWAKIQLMGAKPGDRFLVNNPPGFYFASGQEAVVIPYGDIDTTLAVAARYNVQYLVLDQNYVEGLKSLYEQPQNYPRLEFLGTVKDARIFRIQARK